MLEQDTGVPPFPITYYGTNPLTENVVLSDLDRTLTYRILLTGIVKAINENHDQPVISQDALSTALIAYKNIAENGALNVLCVIAQSLSDSHVHQTEIETIVDNYYEDQQVLLHYVSQAAQLCTSSDFSLIIGTLEPLCFVSPLFDKPPFSDFLTAASTTIFETDEDGYYTGNVLIPDKLDLANWTIEQYQRKFGEDHPMQIIAAGDHLRSDGPMIDAITQAGGQGLVVIKKQSLDIKNSSAQAIYNHAKQKGWNIHKE